MKKLPRINTPDIHHWYVGGPYTDREVLVECPRCHEAISYRYEVCPKCGGVIDPDNPEVRAARAWDAARQRRRWIGFFVAAAFALAAIVYAVVDMY